MSRGRKGNDERNFRTQRALKTERDLPHIVEVELPSTGLEGRQGSIKPTSWLLRSRNKTMWNI
jgi:hypothetical protein